MTTNPEGLREQIARLLNDYFGHHPWPVMAEHRGDLRAKIGSGLDYDINEPTRSDVYEAADAIISGPLQEQLKGSSCTESGSTASPKSDSACQSEGGAP